jgi:uncharacterized protein
MGQFHLTDLAVFKVMFAAIVTAMLGLFWLSRLGVVDVARVYVPETFVPAQLIGGIVFGAGMALAGLCPGTSCVAAATGHVDGVMPSFARFYTSGARGGATLDVVLGVPAGTMVLGVVACAIAGFVAAERVERWTMRRALETGR